MGTFEQYTRPLTTKERRVLNIKIVALKRPEHFGLRYFVALLAVLTPLCILTLIAARDVAWYIVVGFWFSLAIPIYFWSNFSDARQTRSRIRRAEDSVASALAANRASVAHIKSDRMLEFEEEEDEGAFYAFELDDNRVVFVAGQDFYESPRFPNTDFTISEIYDNNGKMAEMTIEKFGEKLKPIRKVPGMISRQLSRWPDHLEVMECKLEDIEQVLSMLPPA